MIKHLMLLIFFQMLATLPARAAETEPPVLLKASGIAVTQQDLQQRLLLLPETERARILSKPEALKNFLSGIYQTKNMVAAAERSKLDEEPLAQAQLVVERQRILAEALREQTRKKIHLPDFAALAREHYAVRRDEFQLPEQFKAAHILKKVECACEREQKKQVLEQLRARLQAGEDFATLANAESDDAASAAKGGDLERWLKRADVVAPFAEALAKLETGQVSDVVETQFGLHLIKKLDYQPARLQSFDEVQQNLEQQLRQDYVKDQLAQRATDYLPPANATFDESALQSLLTKH